jgi:hypothetical protein
VTAVPQAAVDAATAALRSEGVAGQLEALAAIVLEAAAPHIAAAGLMAAHDDLAAKAQRIGEQAQAGDDKTHLGTAAGLWLAAFRVIELADQAAPKVTP